MKRILIFASLALALVVLGPLQATAAPTKKIPTFSITAVDRNNSVTIKTKNFPSGESFVVRMGKYGTLGLGGVKVDTQDSGSGGTFTATYTIPASLKSRDKIAIRLDSSSSGYYSYNWFWNNDHPTSGGSGSSSSSGSGSSSGSTSSPGIGYPSKTPTFTITAVKRNKNVTIKGINFTTNDEYIVRMGKVNTLGVGGEKVISYATDDTGSFTATFDIPPSLKGLDKIAIRLDSKNTAYYSYNWFWNTDSP